MSPHLRRPACFRAATVAAFCAAGLFLVGAPLAAQQPPAKPPAAADSLLAHMAGRWVLRGTIGGQRTVHDVRADVVLARGYVRLHEVSRERAPGGGPAYEAIVFVGRDPVRDGYACLWLDNTGDGGLNGGAIAHADRVPGDSIPFLFHFPDGSRFHTTFLYERAPDRWQWHMDGEGKDGKLEPFARVTLTRS